MIALSDEFGGIYNENGFDAQVVQDHLRRNGRLTDCPGSEPISNNDLLELKVDILIPAAIENQLTQHNANNIRAKLVAELANGPTTPDADNILNDKGIFIIPDFLCNAGGVIVSYFEMVQNGYQFYWDEDTVNQRLERIMVESFDQVAGMAGCHGINLRIGAYMLAIERVAAVHRLRGMYA